MTIIAILLLILSTIGYLLFFRCGITDKAAIQKAKEFCNIFNIACKDEPSISSLPDITSVLAGTPSACDKYKQISFKPDLRDFLINVDCNRREVVNYFNFKVFRDHQDKYSVIVMPKGYSSSYRKWATFIPEQQALNIINSIAAKLAMADDLIFNRIEKDLNEGYWIAKWERKRGGYRYEFDRVEIGITGVTGEFVEYRKLYEGSPCPTNLAINEEKAEELAGKKLRETVGEKTWQEKGNRYVIEKKEILIVNPNIFLLPCKSRNSRLAWIMRYKVDKYFDKSLVNFSSKELNEYLKKERQKWEAIGSPPNIVEIRIDAITGKYLGGYEKYHPWN
jgi:hypothetical protein